MRITRLPALSFVKSRYLQAAVVGCCAFCSSSVWAQHTPGDPANSEYPNIGDVQQPVLIVNGVEIIHGPGESDATASPQLLVAGSQLTTQTDGKAEDQPGLNRQPPRRQRQENPGPPSTPPRGHTGPGGHAGPGGPVWPDGFGRAPGLHGPGNNPPLHAVPGPMPPSMQVPPGGPMGLDHLLDSPTIKKILALMQENMELKAQIKIQTIQAESKMHARELETQLDQLRRQLDHSHRALKDAELSNERLEKRISELEHRSRILEDRAKAIAESRMESRKAEAIQKMQAEAYRLQLQNRSDRRNWGRGARESTADREQSESGEESDEESGEESDKESDEESDEDRSDEEGEEQNEDAEEDDDDDDDDEDEDEEEDEDDEDEEEDEDEDEVDGF
jgi:hypothetical protein